MHDTFISYASEDYGKVRVLGEYLQNECGFRVWMDKANIIGQHGWRSTLTNAIEDSKTLTLVVSKHSVQSEDVETEITLAADAEIPILFIHLENAELSSTMKYLAAGKQSLRFIDREKIHEALSFLVTSELKNATAKPSSFPFSIEEQIRILGIRPNFALGNGKDTLYVHRVDSLRKIWELVLVNKGKDARKVTITVQDEALDKIQCEYCKENVEQNEVIRVTLQSKVHYLKEHHAVRFLVLSYEDIVGTPYSERLSELIDRENRV